MTGPWVTWANLLTLLRLASIPSVVLAIVYLDWTLAAWLFALAIASDILDGRLARRFNQASTLGGLLDHLTDALYVAACTWALAELNLVNPWLAPFILLAFTQYMLDSSALSGKSLRASLLGRYNGIAYYVLVGFGIGAHVTGWLWLIEPVAWASWVLLFSTFVSMGDRGLALLRSRS